MISDLATPVDARTAQRLRAELSMLDARLARLEARITTEHLDVTLDLLALRFDRDVNLLNLLFRHELDLNRALVDPLGGLEATAPRGALTPRRGPDRTLEVRS